MKARGFPLLAAAFLLLTGCRAIEKWQRDRDRPSAEPASRTRDPDWWRNRNRNTDSPYELPRERTPAREPSNLLDPPNVPSSNVRVPSAGTWADPASKNFDVRGASERIISGRVETPDGQVVENAFVALEHADPTKNTPGAQVGVQTDRSGMFMIQGLKPGDSYLLTASVRNWVGKQYVTVPNQRVRIVVRDDFAVQPLTDSASRNDRPSAPSVPPPSSGVTAPPLFDTPRGSDLLPYPDSTDGSFSPVAPARPDLVAPGPQPGFRSALPPVSIPGPAVPPPIQPPSNGSTSKSSSRKTSIRLLDPNGRDRELPSGRASELTLLNFSSTNCIHCVKAIPTLSRLYNDHRNLELVTVLCDEGSTSERIRAAENYRTRHRIPFDVNIEAKRGEVQSAFHVEGYPSLVLIDGNGRTLWEGHPKESSQLERILRDKQSQR